jgi:hypothetical protein
MAGSIPVRLRYEIRALTRSDAQGRPASRPSKPGPGGPQEAVYRTSLRGFHKSSLSDPSSELDKSSRSRSESWTSLELRWRRDWSQAGILAARTHSGQNRHRSRRGDGLRSRLKRPRVVVGEARGVGVEPLGQICGFGRHPEEAGSAVETETMAVAVPRGGPLTSCGVGPPLRAGARPPAPRYRRRGHHGRSAGGCDGRRRPCALLRSFRSYHAPPLSELRSIPPSPGR